MDAFGRFSSDPNIVFLESRGAPGPRCRYSYLCIDPQRLFRDVPISTLQQDLSEQQRLWPDAPAPFAGGFAGFCSYEFGAALQGVKRAPGQFAGVPDMLFGLFDILFAWDHARRRMWLLCAVANQSARANAVLDRLNDTPLSAAVAPHLHWQAPISRAQHLARVGRALKYIHAGDIYQANIAATFCAARPPNLSASDIFLALRDANPAPFTAYVACGNDCAIASVSPERFAALDASGKIEARPIKGTRPRRPTPEADAAEAAALLASDKDRAENLMIVDLLRNDISRIAVPGSVRVPALHRLESFASVHHLVSVVEGQLRADRTAADLLMAALPGGSITGAPKIRAMQIIAELEHTARGPYCGSAGWLGFDGAMDSSILIRTVTIAQDRVVAQAGGGIVADSDPAGEWDELLVKIRPVLRSLGARRPGALPLDPAKGEAFGIH